MSWVGAPEAGARYRLNSEGHDYYSLLRIARVPAVIAEWSYVSNPSEEELLRTGEFRQAYANAVVRALYRFVTTDDSTNLWWVALLTFGEGWHNNHHAHPRAARHGLKWYEIDVNWWGIRTLQLLGLAKDIKLISRAAMPVRAVEQEPLRRAA